MAGTSAPSFGQIRLISASTPRFNRSRVGFASDPYWSNRADHRRPRSDGVFRISIPMIFWGISSDNIAKLHAKEHARPSNQSDFNRAHEGHPSFVKRVMAGAENCKLMLSRRLA